MSGSKIDERGAAVQIVRVLRDAGHTAYFAGGCVRDRLLGVEPKDYDVATDARPDRVGGLFRDCRFVGEAFGVVLVRVASHAIEVSTFRADWGYQDGRRPDSVTFTDARNDAQRRDFTINGLFEDPLAGSDQPRIIDYVGGRDDLERRLLRAIGDPAERFGEDYLRMLRAVRIAARLGFEIEGTTADAIRNTADRLGKISRERIGQEVAWMLTPDSVGPGSGAGGSDPARSIQLMQSLHLDAQVLCEPHDEQGGCQTVERLTQSSDVAAESPGGGILGGLGGLGELADDYPVVLAVWLLDRHGFWNNPDKDASNDPADLPAVMRSWAADTLPPIVKRWRKALCLSNEQRDRLVWILRIAMELVSWETLMIAKRKRLLSMPESAGALAVMMALRHLPQIDRIAPEVYRQACELLRAGVAPTPWVTGYDLIELGIKPGRVIGRLLKQVYDAQLEGTVTDHAQALQWVRNRMCDTSLCSDGGELERE